MAPQPPPPGASIVLAALTMASTSSLVMSPSTISMRSGMDLLETPISVEIKPAIGPAGRSPLKWLGGVGGDALEMRFGEVGFDLRPLIESLCQEVDMHLVGAELRALMAEMGKIERDRVVLGLAEGERRTRAVVAAADEDVVGPGQRRTPDQRVDAVQIAAARGTAPIVE